MKIGKYRIIFERKHQLFRRYGFALTTDGGCMGTTYNEPGKNMTRRFTLTFIYWTWDLNICWKKL